MRPKSSRLQNIDVVEKNFLQNKILWSTYAQRAACERKMSWSIRFLQWDKNMLELFTISRLGFTVGLTESWPRSLGRWAGGKANRGQCGCHVPRLNAIGLGILANPVMVPTTIEKPTGAGTHHGEACQEGGETAERDDKNSKAATHFLRCLFPPLSLPLYCVHFLSIVAVSMNLKAWFQKHKCPA